MCILSLYTPAGLSLKYFCIFLLSSPNSSIRCDVRGLLALSHKRHLFWFHNIQKLHHLVSSFHFIT